METLTAMTLGSFTQFFVVTFLTLDAEYTGIERYFDIILFDTR